MAFPPFEIVYLKSAESPVHVEAIQLEELNAKEKPRIIFNRHLPTTEQLSLLVATIQLVLTVDPLFLSKVKSFLDLFFLNQKFKLAVPSKINMTLMIGDKTIEVKNANVNDSIKIITKEYEVLLKPNKRG